MQQLGDRAHYFLISIQTSLKQLFLHNVPRSEYKDLCMELGVEMGRGGLMQYESNLTQGDGRMACIDP